MQASRFIKLVVSSSRFSPEKIRVQTTLSMNNWHSMSTRSQPLAAKYAAWYRSVTRIVCIVAPYQKGKTHAPKYGILLRALRFPLCTGPFSVLPSKDPQKTGCFIFTKQRFAIPRTVSRIPHQALSPVFQA
jgi:hypothetical protein